MSAIACRCRGAAGVAGLAGDGARRCGISRRGNDPFRALHVLGARAPRAVLVLQRRPAGGAHGSRGGAREAAASVYARVLPFGGEGTVAEGKSRKSLDVVSVAGTTEPMIEVPRPEITSKLN